MEEIISVISNYSNEELQQYFNTKDLNTLHNLKLYVDDIYYNTGEDPGLSDWQYDMLKETLHFRDSDFIVPIGAKVRKGSKKIKLPFWLGSMNKLKPKDGRAISRWLDKNDHDEYIIEDKLDGVSCLLVIDNRGIKMYTRGDGSAGTDISHLYPFIAISDEVRDRWYHRSA